MERRAGSDANLVEAVLRGERTAWDALYRRHAGAVGSVVWTQLCDSDERAEVVQETFARALESLPRLASPERFRPWLLAIARHTAVDARRASLRSSRESLEAADGLATPGPGPTEVAEMAELVELVRGAVARLSGRDATAMALVALGFGVTDVASALGVGRGAAKVALHRARRRLKGRMLLDVLSRHAPPCAEAEQLAATDLLAVAQHLERCSACKEAALSALS